MCKECFEDYKFVQAEKLQRKAEEKAMKKGNVDLDYEEYDGDEYEDDNDDDYE